MAVGFVRIATLVILARNDDAADQILRCAPRNDRGQQYVILNAVKQLLCWKNGFFVKAMPFLRMTKGVKNDKTPFTFHFSLSLSTFHI